MSRRLISLSPVVVSSPLLIPHHPHTLRCLIPSTTPTAAVGAHFKTFSSYSSSRPGSFTFQFPSFMGSVGQATVEHGEQGKASPSIGVTYPFSSVFSLVRQPAPDFTADAVFEDNSIKQLTLSSFIEHSYVLLFFYPLDFTFVCPSEIIAFNAQIDEFKKRQVQVIGVSVDSQFSHAAWKSTPRNKGGIGSIAFPLVADLSKEISRSYGVLSKEGTVALRGLFLIDKKGVVRHTVVNDLPLGRSVGEALRMIDALQHFEQVGEVCPADWTKGKKSMKASAEGVAEYLSSLDR